MGIQKDGVSIRIPKKVVGIKELWQQIVIDFVAACQNKDIQTIIIDSGTQLWSICHNSLLQEKQEEQLAKGAKEVDLRTSLLSIEYGPANDRMKSMIFTARSFSKNLALNHYPKDIYAPRLVGDRVEEVKTGEIDIDGFKQTKALVDIAVFTTFKDNKYTARVTLSGLGPVTGLELENPTYEMLKKAIDMSRGVTT